MSGNSNWKVAEATMLHPLARAPIQTWTKQFISPRVLNYSIIRAKSTNDASGKTLPKLGVPKLKATMDKYLRSLKPLLTQDEYRRTCGLVMEFQCSGAAFVLQEYLEKRAACKRNWLEEWWLNAAYLGFRSPVVIYSSPGQSMPFESFSYEDDRVVYTAKLINGAVTYKMLIDSKKMPTDRVGQTELDMEQYAKIFGTCRIPCLPLDMLQYNRKSEHIIVMHKNHFFKMQVFGADGNPFSTSQILQSLKCILEQSSEPTAPIGILTSDHRDSWSAYIKDLAPGNESAICEIQQSLFLVCFDSDMPGSNSSYPSKQTKGGHQIIHGGGSKGNTGNRWFDKTIQFIIGNDGCLGVTYEHSPSEGQPIAYMVDYIYNFIKKDVGKSIPTNCPEQTPTRLCFKINDTIQKHIDTASSNIDKLIANFELECFKFDGYGKDFIKKHKMSPDSYIQMAMQYAYFKLYGCAGAHYESGTLRKFIGGRTETIRSCSVESLQFAKAMLDECKEDKDKLAALTCAIEAHKKYTIQAMDGCGVDRHLLGIKMAAKEMECKEPEIFCDVGFQRSTDFRMSTSQVATKCDAVMGYGPTSPEGYGICYNPRDHDINFAISCFVDGCTTTVERYKFCFVEALCEMQELLVRMDKSKSSDKEKSKM